MYRKNRILYAEWIFVIIYWIVVFYLYYIYIFWGYGHLFTDNILKQYFNSNYIHIEILVQSILFGISFNLINTLTDQTKIRRLALWKIISIKTAFYLVAAFLTEMFIVDLFYLFNITEKNYYEFHTIATPGFYISFLSYFLFSILFINFFLQMNRKIGPGNMFKLLLGRYHQPREEKRIFMFLDLVGSTTIAEELGHNKYSQLLRDCFHDLTDIVLKYEAEIYQYVGDEVVLSWTEKNGLMQLNCIKTFFAYENEISAKQTYYLDRFNILPQFRAGLDMGMVTVAEIGDIKREIAFHGDVLNTAARLQGICKNYDCKMLISDTLAKNLNSSDGFRKQLIGEIKLRGKKERTKVYQIDREKINV